MIVFKNIYYKFAIASKKSMLSSLSFMISIGVCLVNEITFSATLPSIKDAMVVRPLEPIITRPALTFFANSEIFSA